MLVFVGFLEGESESVFWSMRGHSLVAMFETALGSSDDFEGRSGIRKCGTGILASV